MSRPSLHTLLCCTSGLALFPYVVAAKSDTDQSCDALVDRARSAFSDTFEPQGGPVAVTFAPGRVNLIGEHTDYTGGYVLPIALELGTVAMGRVSRDGLSRFYSVDKGGEPAVFAATDAPNPRAGGWERYVHGVLAQYTDIVDASLQETGHWGIEAVVASTVPLGSGLSSSASLEVAVATLVEELFHVGAPTVSLASKARRCQLAEHNYAGVPCGMMDQLASVAGTADHAVMIDTRETAAATANPTVDSNARTVPGVSLVPLADPNVRIVVIDSHERHALSDGEEPWYPQRVSQCATALGAILNATESTAKSLRDCTLDMLERTRPASHGQPENEGWKEPIWYRRARHVISENQRVLDGANALRHRDWALFGQLMLASHASLRDDYEVTTAKLDWLSAEASKIEGIYGARMTGAGFGGCVPSPGNIMHCLLSACLRVSCILTGAGRGVGSGSRRCERLENTNSGRL